VGTPPRRCSLRGSPSDTLIGVSYVVYEKCVSRMGKQYSTSPSRRFEIDRGRSIDRRGRRRQSRTRARRSMTKRERETDEPSTRPPVAAVRRTKARGGDREGGEFETEHLARVKLLITRSRIGARGLTERIRVTIQEAVREVGGFGGAR